MTSRWALVAAVVALTSLPVGAQTLRNVRVSLEFRQSGTTVSQGGGASGGVIVTAWRRALADARRR